MNTTPHPTSPDADAAVAWYAEALALVHHLRLQHPSDIAAHLRVTPQEWTSIDDAWTTALTGTGALLAPEVALSFASTFARARRRLLQSMDEPSAMREMPTYLRRPPATYGESWAPLPESRAVGPGRSRRQSTVRGASACTRARARRSARR